MYPVTPVHPSIKLKEVIYAKDQPEYIPLPAYKWKDGTVVSRWKLSWKERLQILFSGNLFLAIKTYNNPLQPVLISSEWISETEKQCQ